jgi:hypothetical protein
MNQECENGPNAEWEMGDDIQGRCKTQRAKFNSCASAEITDL